MIAHKIDTMMYRLYEKEFVIWFWMVFLVTGQFSEGGVHFIGKTPVSVLVDAQFICVHEMRIRFFYSWSIPLAVIQFNDQRAPRENYFYMCSEQSIAQRQWLYRKTMCCCVYSYSTAWSARSTNVEYTHRHFWHIFFQLNCYLI